MVDIRRATAVELDSRADGHGLIGPRIRDGRGILRVDQDRVRLAVGEAVVDDEPDGVAPRQIDNEGGAHGGGIRQDRVAAAWP